MKNLKQIVTEWLKSHGYDGLYHHDAQCGCDFDCLMECGDANELNCVAAYKHLCEKCDMEGDCEYEHSPGYRSPHWCMKSEKKPERIKPNKIRGWDEDDE